MIINLLCSLQVAEHWLHAKVQFLCLLEQKVVLGVGARVRWLLLPLWGVGVAEPDFLTLFLADLMLGARGALR